MSVTKRINERGLSLKITSRLMLAASIILMTVLIIASAHAFINFRRLERSTDTYITLEEQAISLMDASDYLTEQVQCYTVLNDRVYMEKYFNEAFEVKRRENAISALESSMPESTALYELKDSMRHSVNLMDREYYAMRLVLDAMGDEDIPEVLQDVVLTEEDASLSAEEKLELAINMVHNSEYYYQKNEIRRNMNDCLKALKTSTFASQQGLEISTRKAIIGVMVLVLIQTVLIVAIIWLHAKLGITPVLRAVDHIRRDESLPVIGSSEFRYLAGTYNDMFNAYKNSISNLSFKASHDELTGVYNRAGYEFIKNTVDLTTTAMLIIDADNFKHINDNYGHETGDKVLKKVADTLRKHFRSEDYICRIGGDEFLILMVHTSSDPQLLIKNKMRCIGKELGDTADDTPPVTLSVGVTFSEEEIEPDVMFRQADTALYRVKENGRNGCMFYSEIDA